MNLASRIRRIEARTAPEMMVVVITGGLPGEIRHASARKGEGERFDFVRHMDEAMRDFQARVTGEAKEMGADVLVIGGLRR